MTLPVGAGGARGMPRRQGQRARAERRRSGSAGAAVCRQGMVVYNVCSESGIEHDQSYKLLFSHARMVEDLLRGFVREPWVQHQALIRSGEVRSGERLPPVLPLVLYNGRDRWTAPLEVADLIATRPVGLRPYRPRLRYLVLEERRYGDAELTALENMAAALFRLEKSREPADVQRVVQALMAWLDHPGDDSIRRAFVVWLKRVLLPGRLPGMTVPEVQTLEEMHTMLAERVREWTIEWKEAGLAAGRAEAERQALERYRQLLLYQVQQRFGDAAAQALVPMLEAIEDPERFTSIAGAIVVCASAEELLQQVGQITASHRP